MKRKLLKKISEKFNVIPLLINETLHDIVSIDSASTPESESMISKTNNTDSEWLLSEN